MKLSIKEAIDIQRTVADPTFPIESAIGLLMGACGMDRTRAEYRVLRSRGLIGPDDNPSWNPQID